MKGKELKNHQTNEQVINTTKQMKERKIEWKNEQLEEIKDQPLIFQSRHPNHLLTMVELNQTKEIIQMYFFHCCSNDKGQRNQP